MADPRLENYLSTLDRALSGLPVSDRADIVTEIKSHVLSALERDPAQSVDSVLAALGEAEVVANRYLLECGLKPGKPPVSPVVKWIVIGFLGTLALGLICLVLVGLYLSPIVKVDESKQSVSLLGGLFQVNGEDIEINGESWGKMHSFSGRAERPGAGKSTSIRIGNGKLSLATSSDEYLSWNCRGGASDGIQTNPAPAGGDLDFTSHGFVKCEIQVPKGASVSLTGANGRIELDQPKFSVSAELANGKVSIAPDSSSRYAYDLDVTNGKTDSFVSDPNPDYKIRVRLTNGKISQ